MEDYKPNSNKSKAEKKAVTQIANGKIKKKSGIKKVADNLINDDIHNVKNYVVMDILIPAAKKAVFDIITNGIDMILYGETGHSKKRNSTYVSYNKFSRSSDDRYRERTIRTSSYSLDDIILDSRGEAEEVIDQLGELIDNYGVASVADLYDLVGITCNYTDNKYGWNSIRYAEAVRTREGYMLKLPKVKPID